MKKMINKKKKENRKVWVLIEGAQLNLNKIDNNILSIDNIL